jgi:hypothetical protein
MSSASRNGKITSVLYHDDATIEGKGSHCLEAALAMALEASSASGGETEEEEKTCIETEKAPAADFDPIEASEKSSLAFTSTAEDGDSRSKPSYFEPVPDVRLKVRPFYERYLPNSSLVVSNRPVVFF